MRCGQIQRKVLFSTGLLCCLMAIRPVSSAAQTVGRASAVGATSKLVNLDKDARRNFDMAFRKIAEQADVTILAEGVPIHPELTDKDVAALNAAVPLGRPAQIDPLLKAEAAAFDYDVTAFTPKIYLLRKRYSDPNELPCVTFEEVRNAIKQIYLLGKRYGGEPEVRGEWNPTQRLFRSLTPQQVEAAQSGLTLRQLSAEQQELARAAAVDVAMNRELIQFKQVLNHLDGLDDPKTIFTYMIVAGTPCFGYRGPLAPDRVMSDFPINNHFQITSGGVQKVFKATSSNAPKKPIVPSMYDDENDDSELGPDLTRPTDEDRRLARGMYAIRLPSTLSLGEYCDDLLRKAPASSRQDGALKIWVDPGLRQKPLSVFGLRPSDVDTMIRAVGNLYQLSLIRPKRNEYNFVQHEVGDLQDDSDFSSAIERVVPDSLRRAISGQSASYEAQLNENDEADSPNISVQNMVMERHQFNALIHTVNAYYYDASHRLLVLSKPLVPHLDSPVVRLRDADPEVRRLISLMLFSDNCLMLVRQLELQPIPHFLLHPEAMVVKMIYTPQGKQDALKTVWGYNDAAGTFHAEASPIIFGHTLLQAQ